MNKNLDNKHIEVPESFKSRIRIILESLPEKEIEIEKNTLNDK